jgi:hypothetical protein
MPPSSIHMDHIRTTQQSARADAAGTPTPQKAADDEGMSFWDVLDVVNPLQHIPIVNKIYQAVTGDTIKTPAKLAGGALFFGPIGLAAAAADAVVEKETGKDVVDNVTGWLGLGGKGQADKAPAAPTEDDLLTVTAPRPRKAASATEQPQKAASLPVQELSGGQAAALERLMASSQGGSAETGSTARTAKAVGGIGNAQQLKDLQTMPGASAAAIAASGLGTSAAVASLPAPGSGGGNDVIAAMAQQQQKAKSATGGTGAGKNGQAQGMTLADYRANAVHRSSLGVKPLVPSSAVQLAQQQNGMPGTRAVVTIPVSPQDKAAATESADPAITAQPAVAATTTSVTSTTQPAVAVDQPGTPPSKERIAELMLMGITKYQQQQANATNAASATAAANSNGGTAARKAGNE